MKFISIFKNTLKITRIIVLVTQFLCLFFIFYMSITLASPSPLLNSYFPPHERPEEILTPYLISQSPVRNSDGILTVVTNVLGGFGDLVYAQVITAILLQAYPEKQIRVIFEAYSRDLKTSRDFFSCPSGIECQFIATEDIYSPEVIQWLNEASLIIVASVGIAPVRTGDFQFIKFGELSTTRKPHEDSVDWLTALHDNYDGLVRKMSLDSTDRNFFNIKYWCTRSDTYLELFDTVEQVGKLKPFRELTNNLLQTCSADEACMQYYDLANPDKSTDHESKGQFNEDPMGVSSSSAFGLEPEDLGVLLRPSLLEALAIDSISPLQNQFNLLLSNHPMLSSYLNGKSSPPEYYLTYMHNSLGFAEYIAIVSYLNPETIPVILSNISPDLFEDPIFTQLLAINGISQIFYTDLSNQEVRPQERTFKVGYGGKSIRLATLPMIPDDQQYLSLIAQAQQPVGVTGNMSLFDAIALKKIPIYDIWLDYQRDVNSSLRRFDQYGKLDAVFDNRFLPQEKALAIQYAGNSVSAWSDSIINNKLANPMLLSMVDHLINNKNHSLFDDLEQLQKTAENVQHPYEYDTHRLRSTYSELVEATRKQCGKRSLYYQFHQTPRTALSSVLRATAKKHIPLWMFYDDNPKPDCEVP
ncbi:hypothetical protein EOPP23_12805 [Endozoicomonas sp. OPT23]|uniref:hypothetical protein n=1 Tax=Endozoicomonas sp. OPT23 TaxID=2072845 RepID=UPI00129BD1D9|nr:hypothetical protein [Endozoicomonas sp. OPT23]MRI33867.1 hypothetical protein [Endozoicomonas sp. OPT23]